MSFVPVADTIFSAQSHFTPIFEVIPEEHFDKVDASFNPSQRNLVIRKQINIYYSENIDLFQVSKVGEKTSYLRQISGLSFR